jgi:hypothetical protein
VCEMELGEGGGVVFWVVGRETKRERKKATLLRATARDKNVEGKGGGKGGREACQPDQDSHLGTKSSDVFCFFCLRCRSPKKTHTLP